MDSIRYIQGLDIVIKALWVVYLSAIEVILVISHENIIDGFSQF